MKKILFAAPHYFSGSVRVGGQNYAIGFSDLGWKVGYVSTFLSPFKIGFLKDRESIGAQWKILKKGGETIGNNVWAYVPFTLIPHHNHTFLDKGFLLNNYYRFSIPPIKYLMKKKGLLDIDILWLDCPHQNFWRKLLKYKFIVYRVSDNIQFFKNTGTNLISAHEDAMLFSDLIIVTSKILLKKLKEEYKNKKIVYCPNGVNLDNFCRNIYKEPEEYKKIKGKKALYIGAIEEWFNVRLLIYLADNSPDTNFVIIGPDNGNIMEEVHVSNIIYLGPKPYNKIPDYIYYCDYGIIPFRSTELIQTVNPIKMYEFFSLGKPVVSTSWDELELIDTPCNLAHSKEEFLEIINDNKRLHNYDYSHLHNYAKQNTWEKRILYIQDMIGELAVKTLKPISTN